MRFRCGFVWEKLRFVHQSKWTKVRFGCIRVEKGCVNALMGVRDWRVFAILRVIIIWIGVPYGGF